MSQNIVQAYNFNPDKTFFVRLVNRTANDLTVQLFNVLGTYVKTANGYDVLAYQNNGTPGYITVLTTRNYGTLINEIGKGMTAFKIHAIRFISSNQFNLSSNITFNYADANGQGCYDTENPVYYKDIYQREDFIDIVFQPERYLTQKNSIQIMVAANSELYMLIAYDQISFFTSKIESVIKKYIQ